jgi:hypothetical protein
MLYQLNLISRARVNEADSLSVIELLVSENEVHQLTRYGGPLRQERKKPPFFFFVYRFPARLKIPRVHSAFNMRLRHWMEIIISFMPI